MATVDRLVAEGVHPGYQRIPETRSEEVAAIACLRDAIAEEPW